MKVIKKLLELVIDSIKELANFVDSVKFERSKTNYEF